MQTAGNGQVTYRKEVALEQLAAALGNLCDRKLAAGQLPWEDMAHCHIYDRTMLGRVPRPTSGKILAHAKRQACAFREFLGVQVSVFKIGVTAGPLQRFRDYVSVGFTHMWIIFQSEDLSLIHMLEAALISEFNQCPGCRNAPGTGGEGALNRANHAGPPYFVYISGGRADQQRRVG